MDKRYKRGKKARYGRFGHQGTNPSPLDERRETRLPIPEIGADVIILPGDFRNFSFCVDHIGEILDSPLTKKEKALLDNEFLTVKDYPFFDPRR